MTSQQTCEPEPRCLEPGLSERDRYLRERKREEALDRLIKALIAAAPDTGSPKPPAQTDRDSHSGRARLLSARATYTQNGVRQRHRNASIRERSKNGSQDDRGKQE